MWLMKGFMKAAATCFKVTRLDHGKGEDHAGCTTKVLLAYYKAVKVSSAAWGRGIACTWALKIAFIGAMETPAAPRRGNASGFHSYQACPVRHKLQLFRSFRVKLYSLS